MREAALSAALAAALAAAPAAAAPRRAAARPSPQAPAELVEQTGHSLSVDAVALSADGRLAATAGKDGKAILWDAAAGHKLREVTADPLGATAVALSADGKRLLTAGAGTAILWDSETGKALRRFGRPGEFLTAALLADSGRAVLTAGGDATARLYDAATGKPLKEYGVEAQRLTGAALTADGSRLALAAGKDEVWLFDAKSGAMLKALAAGGAALRVAFSPDGRRLAAGGEDGVWVWDLPEGRPVGAFKAPASRGLAFMRGGAALVTCGGGNTARVWSLEGEAGRSFIGHTDSVRSLALSPDGRRLLTGSDDRSARLWDPETGRELRRLAGAPAPVLETLVSADGRRLVTVDAQTARLWDLDSGALVRVTTGDFSASSSWSLSASGKLLADVRDRELVDLKNLETGQDFGTFQWNLLRASQVALSADGTVVATANEERLQLWDAATMREKPGAPKTDSRVNRLWTALGGRRLLYMDGYGALHLWDVPKAAALADWPARGPAPPDTAVSADGGFVATAEPGDGRSVFSIRSLGDGALLAAWDADGGASPYAFSPGGRQLLIRAGAGVWDWEVAGQRAAHAWEPPRGAELRWPRGVDPRWKWLAASSDGSVVFLSMDKGRELARLSLREQGWILRAPDGRLDASEDALRWTRGLSSLPLGEGSGARRVRGLLGRLLRDAP
jgi:WD40 repeat protein